ncbi:putative calcium-binding protein CML23 [Lolium perenne]|uniref:putative calcium-binding protein CML23 n=1 Tax=Lolium perenne TaxID=4522 RepID=UPI0021F57AEE|nr:putative calcium-binding protein CML23 [Lolium perenne]
MVASAEFRRVFAAFDQNGDGKISETELQLCMKAALGFLDEEEFVRLVEETAAGTQDEEGDRCREAFGMYVMEGRGCITPLSVKLMLSRLGLQLDVDECQVMIRRFDLNGDGVLTFDEFKTMMMT